MNSKLQENINLGTDRIPNHSSERSLLLARSSLARHPEHARVFGPLKSADLDAGITISPYLFSRRKRLLDVVGALAILTILAPLLIIVALIVRSTSRGPALFCQARTGARGNPFTLYKFRSMHLHAIDNNIVVQASQTDARITAIGRFIRRTSVDELPQIFNVLEGTMSLVGPRPHAIQHDEYYSKRITSYRQRFAARPGLSGLAQINGARGATPLIRDMERRIAYDLDYIRSASLIGDIRIIGATIREMIFSKSAY